MGEVWPFPFLGSVGRKLVSNHVYRSDPSALGRHPANEKGRGLVCLVLLFSSQVEVGDKSLSDESEENNHGVGDADCPKTEAAT